MQTQIRRRKTRRLIRVFTICKYFSHFSLMSDLSLQCLLSLSAQTLEVNVEVYIWQWQRITDRSDDFIKSAPVRLTAGVSSLSKYRFAVSYSVRFQRAANMTPVCHRLDVGTHKSPCALTRMAKVLIILSIVAVRTWRWKRQCAWANWFLIFCCRC